MIYVPALVFNQGNIFFFKNKSRIFVLINLIFSYRSQYARCHCVCVWCLHFLHLCGKISYKSVPVIFAANNNKLEYIFIREV